MISGSLPRRYARALLAAARDKGLDIARLADELGSMAGLFAPDSALGGYFANPFMSALRKGDVLEKAIAASALSPLMGNFLRLLHRKGRLGFLPEIHDEYRRLADDIEGIVRGEVISAAALPPDVIEGLRAKLAATLSRKVVLAARINPDMIGGITVKIGSMSFDGSVRSQLDRIREQLSERVSF